MTESEVWKDVVGFEGLYKVSNKGNVYSVGRRDLRGNRRRGRMLKPKYNGSGYLTVNMYKNGKPKTRTVHRLVAETFLPNPNDLPQVNHRDEDKDNNNVENLEWCDSKYNINYGTRTERLSKKVRAVNIKTDEVLEFNSTQDAGRKGYTQGAVAAACRGAYYARGHAYKGYIWSYEEAEGNESK